LIDKGCSPLDYRYFLLMTHYRKKIKFSFDNLEAAKNGYNNLKYKLAELLSEKAQVELRKDIIEIQRNLFLEAINDDLNTPEALALLWNIIKDDQIYPSEKIYLANDFDKIFGLDLSNVQPRKGTDIIPEEIIKLAEQRKNARANKDFKLADALRIQIQDAGFEIIDLKENNYEIRRKI